jgi:streptogramin lyase
LAVALLAAGCGEDDEPASAGDEFGETTEQTATVNPEAPPEPEVERIAVEGRPDAIAAGAGYVFVTDSFAGSLQRINPRSLRVRNEPVAGFPIDVAAGEGAGWVAYPDTGTVQRVDARRPGEVIEVSGFPFEVAAGEGAVWAMSQKTVERIDPGTGESEGSPTRLGGSGASIAAGEGWVWVARRNREVVRISPDDGELSTTVAEVPNAFSVTTGESAAWALGAPQPGAPGTVTRIDPDTGSAAGDPVQVPDALDVAAGLGYLWVSSSDGNVRRFDPATGAQIGRPVEVGPQPQAIAIGEGALWVASARGRAVFRVTP